MSKTVWAIVYTEIEDGCSDLEDWYVGTAMFDSRSDAITYANALNDADSLYVHDVMGLSVF